MTDHAKKTVFYLTTSLPAHRHMTSADGISHPGRASYDVLGFPSVLGAHAASQRSRCACLVAAMSIGHSRSLVTKHDHGSVCVREETDRVFILSMNTDRSPP